MTTNQSAGRLLWHTILWGIGYAILLWWAFAIIGAIVAAVTHLNRHKINAVLPFIISVIIALIVGLILAFIFHPPRAQPVSSGESSD